VCSRRTFIGTAGAAAILASRLPAQDRTAAVFNLYDEVLSNRAGSPIGFHPYDEAIGLFDEYERTLENPQTSEGVRKIARGNFLNALKRSEALSEEDRIRLTASTVLRSLLCDGRLRWDGGFTTHPVGELREGLGELFRRSVIQTAVRPLRRGNPPRLSDLGQQVLFSLAGRPVRCRTVGRTGSGEWSPHRDRSLQPRPVVFVSEKVYLGQFARSRCS
jgi:hypothetical protein